MNVSSNDICYSISYALAQVGIVYVFIGKKRSLALMPPLFAWFYLAMIYGWGERLAGFITSVFIVPILFMVVFLSLMDGKIRLRYLAISLLFQLIYSVADAHSNLFSKIWDKPARSIIYYVCISLLSILYAYMINKLITVIKKSHICFLKAVSKAVGGIISSFTSVW